MAHDSLGDSRPTPLWRFTLRQFLAAIAFIALGCVALRSASSWWVSAMLGLTLFVLTASLLLVVYRRDADRAWWAGFATFGWAYVLMLILGWTLNAGPLRTSGLVTNKLSRAAHEWLYSEADAGTGGYGSSSGYGGYGSGGADMGYGSRGYGSSMPGTSGAPPAYGGYGGMGPPPPNPPPPAFSPPTMDHFVNVAHALWALVLAFGGGWVSLVIYWTGRRQAPEA
ncbi:MAG: hypothetical protein L0211_03860 [Planctomycetaceae bacterium]|nr:hypothetical protein [Planctomycetaceae bacterium]